MNEPLYDASSASSEGAEDVAVIYAGDYVNKLSAERIERECRLSLEQGCRALLINFKGTEIVNSIGVSILLGVIDSAEQTGARLVFVNVNRHTVKLFELLGLTRLVPLAESEEDALTALTTYTVTSPGH